MSNFPTQQDYYYDLKIKRIATEEEIQTNFKKLALKHHPMKNPNEMDIHLQKFHRICEAYEVLSNRKLPNSFLISN